MSPLNQAMTMSRNGLPDAISRPVGFVEQVTGVYHTGVCHSDLLSGNDTSPKAITCAPTLLFPAGRPRAFSFIRTLTVGSGLSPDLLTLPVEGARGLARL